MAYQKILVRMLPLLLIVPGLALAGSDVGKVRQKVGSVARLKVNKDVWDSLKVGSKIYQSDFIRTGMEAILGIQFTDGSTVSIGENAEVEMSNLFESDGKGAFRTKLNIRKGFVDFDVKKQIKESTFQFKTGTATASIRGTSGFVGGEDGAFYASLATGKFDIQQKDDGPVMPVVAGETMFGTDSLITLKLASSGKSGFATKVKKVLQETKGDVNKMVQAVKNADAEYQKLAAQNNFTVKTASPVGVCNDGFTIEGTYTANDSKASLVVKLGDSYTSDNLARMTDGKSHPFTVKIPVNDANRLWNETSATVLFKSAGVSDSKTIEMNVNKTCSAVNQQAPLIKFIAYDSIACKMQASVENMQDDAGILALLVDGSSVTEEAITKNVLKQFKLNSGVHSYGISVKDQAGNEASLEKKLGCYPVKRFNIEVFGKPKEPLNVPIPPKDYPDNIVRTLQFKIKSPENDPVFLYKVTIKRNGKIILQETLGQIQSLDYQVPLELTRGGQNKFDIEVIHRSGFVAKAKKIFEVQ